MVSQCHRQKAGEACRYSWHSSRRETRARKQSQRKLNEKQQHWDSWNGTGRDPPNGRRVKKGKSNRNGKPRCMDEMDNIKKEAELGRNLEDGTTPYPVPFKISVCSAAIANQATNQPTNQPTNLHNLGPYRKNMNWGTLEHILSSWYVSLTQGRYRWRHDQVLRELADIIEKERKKKRGQKRDSKYINFVKEGKQQSRNPRKRSLSWIQQHHLRCRQTSDDSWYFQTLYTPISTLTLYYDLRMVKRL